MPVEREIIVNAPFSEAELRLLETQIRLSGCESPEEYLLAIMERECARIELDDERVSRIFSPLSTLLVTVCRRRCRLGIRRVATFLPNRC